MTTELSAFAVLAFVTCITPGPNNALAAATGARFGGPAGLALACGVTVGCTGLIVLSALGVAGAIAATPWLSRVLALASAGYLAWLTWRLLRSDAGVRRDAARPPRFVEAVALQFVNPKGWALALAGTTLVLAPSGAHALRLAAMCVLEAVISFASVMAWVALGARLQHWLADARRRRAFNSVMALGLAGCAMATLVAAF
ncbi:LysE family translocator [Tahibacter sp.]|uniref:LysE family translocator n=1 Tax=Tahibacter sp. TaxID=2056211 RepID=UPI0028C4E1A3|nr:LysE family translocator [Tahibacter sp.]